MLIVASVHLVLCQNTWFLDLLLEISYWHIPMHKHYSIFLAVQVERDIL